MCDNGLRQQVRFYDVKSGKPKLRRTFGQEGGLSAGTPGEALPDKLFGPTGAGIDADGNLYVGLSFDSQNPTGGCVIRSLDPSGKLRWECANSAFSVVYDAVPAPGGLELFGPREIFFLPNNAKPGALTLRALTLDPATQQKDPRQAKMLLQATTAVRDLAGQRYLFTWGSGGNSPIEVTRLNDHGLLGRNVATLAPKDGVWAWDVDAEGHVWREADTGKKIVRHRFLGLRGDVPRWEFDQPETWVAPEGVTEVCRLAYDTKSDALYLSGYTRELPKPEGQWGLSGSALVRVDGWLKGKRELRWTAPLLLDDAKLPPKAISQAGDYIFAAACQPTAGLHGVIYVYSAKDGKLVGRISGAKEFTQRTGWVDLSHGLRARDGQFQATEFTKASDLTMLPVTVDAAGNLWYLLEKKSISVLDADKLDAHGVPAWNFATARHLAWPTAFTGENGSLRRIVVAPDGKALVAFGFTKDLPSVIGHNMPLGRLAVRYAIEGTALRETHRVVLPYDVKLQNAPHDQGYVATGAGDFIFVGYEQRMTVLVYKAATLELVGHIDIGLQSQTPIFDGPPELIVSRLGAAYELFLPQYTGNATTVLTWKPSDKIWIPAPTHLSATRLDKAVELSWKSATNAAVWQIERRTLQPTGWSVWKKAGGVKMSLTTWRDSAPPASACAYRLRALGPDGAASDWSGTRHVR